MCSFFSFLTTELFCGKARVSNCDKGVKETDWSVLANLGIDDEDEGSSAREDHLVVKRGVEEVHLSGEVPDLEVHEGASREVVLVYLVGALQEERLVGRHLVEDHLKNII